MPSFRVEPSLGKGRVFFGDPRERREQYLWLGRLAEIGNTRCDLMFDVSAEHVVAIVGKRGSGKSFSLGVLCEGLSASDPDSIKGRLDPSHAVLLLDSLNIYWPSSRPVPAEPPAEAPSVAEQAQLLKRWGMEGQGVRARVWAPAGYRDETLGEGVRELRFAVADMEAQDWGDLFGVDLVRDPMGQALDEVWSRSTSDAQQRGASLGLDDVLSVLDEDDGLKRVYARETMRALTQRFRAMNRIPVFGSDGTPLSELLEPGVMSVVSLGTVPDDLRAVFVSILARRLMAERAKASARAKRAALGLEQSEAKAEIPQTWLMIDEAQNLLPTGRSTAATEALVKFVREGRNSGLSFAVATQQPTAVDNRIMAQVDTLIAHQLVTPKDVKVVSENLKSPPPRVLKHGNRRLTLKEAMALLEAGQAVVSSPELARAAIMNVRPRTSIHGGFEA